MDPQTLDWAQVILQSGPLGIVVLIWWLNDRRYQEILGQYKNDMHEMRKMYENNVELVKRTQGIAQDMKDVVILNCQNLQRLVDAIEKNQYCPLMRRDEGKRTNE